MSDEQREPMTLDEFREGMKSVRAAFATIAEQMARGMREFWESPAGQQLKAVVEYYDEHPEELAALREANRARPTCDCLCAKWNHLGTCVTDATTTVPISSPMTGLVQVPMCGPCAADVRASVPA